MLDSAAIEGRISGIVDIPNAWCSLYLPTAIFNFGMKPTAAGPTVADGPARRDLLICDRIALIVLRPRAGR